MDSRDYHHLLNSVSGDLFQGNMTADFVDYTPFCEIKNQKIDGTVIIRGPKYPPEQFPHGLNGLLVELLINSINEPSLPEVSSKTIF
jgi:hypothetical protein